MKTIDLAKYRSSGIKVFSGRDRGVDVRKKAKLATLEKNTDVIKIIIPPDTISFNTSFFLGFLGASVRALGDKFEEKYQFSCDPIHEPDIKDGIMRARLESNVLDK